MERATQLLHQRFSHSQNAILHDNRYLPNDACGKTYRARLYAFFETPLCSGKRTISLTTLIHKSGELFCLRFQGEREREENGSYRGALEHNRRDYASSQTHYAHCSLCIFKLTHKSTIPKPRGRSAMRKIHRIIRLMFFF